MLRRKVLPDHRQRPLKLREFGIFERRTPSAREGAAGALAFHQVACEARVCNFTVNCCFADHKHGIVTYKSFCKGKSQMCNNLLRMSCSRLNRNVSIWHLRVSLSMKEPE